MGRLLYKLTGERRFTIAEEDCAKLLSLIGKEKLWIYGDKRDGGNFSFYAGAKDAKTVLYICRNNCIPCRNVSASRDTGLYSEIQKRYGIFIGCSGFRISCIFLEIFYLGF